MTESEFQSFITAVEKENQTVIAERLLPTLQHAINQLDETSIDDMKSDHVLFIGDRTDTLPVLDVLIKMLRERKICEPAIYECDKTIEKNIGSLRDKPHKTEYLVLKDLQFFPFDDSGELLNNIMRHRRVICTGSNLAKKRSPENISQQFRFVLNLKSGNNPTSLIAIEEAATKANIATQEIVRLAIEEEVQLFCFLGQHMYETGEITIKPDPSNPIYWAEGKQNDFAYPLPYPALSHLKNAPNPFNLKGYGCDASLPVLIPKEYAVEINNKSEIFITYGTMPDGIDFRVIDPPRGATVTTSGLYLLKSDIDLLTSADQPEENEKRIILPDNTEWSDITIRFVSDSAITITIKKNRPLERTFKSFLFSQNSKNKNPSKAWYNLLTMAAHRGYPPTDLGITTKHVSILRKELKKIFAGVEGDPFGPYRKHKGWPLKIHLTVSENLLANPFE